MPSLSMMESNPKKYYILKFLIYCTLMEKFTVSILILFVTVINQSHKFNHTLK